ncbi:MAG: hypothetical protein KDB00_08340 [Planctomycetales bacterium]|nr:hypothetical protein [Planctomycetales bacterium]
MQLLDKLLKREQSEAEQQQAAAQAERERLDAVRGEVAKLVCGEDADEVLLESFVESSDHLQRCLAAAKNACDFYEVQDHIDGLEAAIDRNRAERLDLVDQLKDGGDKPATGSMVRRCRQLVQPLNTTYQPLATFGESAPVTTSPTDWDAVQRWREAVREVEDAEDRIGFLLANEAHLKRQVEIAITERDAIPFVVANDSDNDAPLDYELPH